MAGLLQVVVSAFVTLLMAASCASDDATGAGENSVAGNACYISNVSFSTMRRPVTVKASDGVTDSTYFSSFVTSSWVFSIDHKKLLVENRDSLPYTTDLAKCVMGLSYVGAIAYYRAPDAWNDDPWIPYNGTDSIDLSNGLDIRVVATDNTERLYRLNVNVHTMHGDSLRWVTVGADPLMSGDHPMKAIGWEDRMAVMVNDGSAVLWLTHTASNLGEWTQQVTDLPTTVDVTSLAYNAYNGQLYVNTTGGELYASADGGAWSMLYQREGLRVVGVSESNIYITAGGATYAASVEDMVWEEEKIDDDALLLPDMQRASVFYTDKKGVERLLLVGNRSLKKEDGTYKDATAVVWSKAWDEFEDENAEVWMHYNRTWDNNHQLPMLEHLNLVYYDNKVMAIGGGSLDGKVEALDAFRVSEDNGLTWWKLQDVMPPSELAKANGYIAAGVDRNKFLWVIAGGKVFRGRINRLGFARPDIG